VPREDKAGIPGIKFERRFSKRERERERERRERVYVEFGDKNNHITITQVIEELEQRST